MDYIALNQAINGSGGGSGLAGLAASLHRTNTLRDQHEKELGLRRDQMIMDNGFRTHALGVEDSFRRDELGAKERLTNKELDNAHDIATQELEIDRLRAQAEVGTLDAQTQNYLYDLEQKKDKAKAGKTVNALERAKVLEAQYGKDVDSNPEYMALAEELAVMYGNRMVNQRQAAQNARVKFAPVGDSGNVVIGLQNEDGTQVPITEGETKYGETPDANVLVTKPSDMIAGIRGQTAGYFKGGMLPSESYETIAEFNNTAEEALGTVAYTALQARHGQAVTNLTGDEQRGLSAVNGEAYTAAGRKDEDAVRDVQKADAMKTEADKAQDETSAFVARTELAAAESAVSSNTRKKAAKRALQRFKLKDDRWFDFVQDMWDSNNVFEGRSAEELEGEVVLMLSDEKTRQHLKAANGWQRDMPHSEKEWSSLLTFLGENPEIVENFREGKNPKGERL